MRYFNTSGPCVPGVHYMLPPEARLPEARELIDSAQYFVVRAPRQTGKTTTLSALARTLTAEGRYGALRFSCETGEPTKDDYEAAQRDLLSSMRRAARRARLDPSLAPPERWPDAPATQLLQTALEAWAESCIVDTTEGYFRAFDAARGVARTGMAPPR